MRGAKERDRKEAACSPEGLGCGAWQLTCVIGVLEPEPVHDRAEEPRALTWHQRRLCATGTARSLCPCAHLLGSRRRLAWRVREVLILHSTNGHPLSPTHSRGCTQDAQREPVKRETRCMLLQCKPAMMHKIRGEVVALCDDSAGERLGKLCPPGW